LNGQEPEEEDTADLETSIARKRLIDIERVILVGSGKGGVGKSFVSCGLALALAKEGYKTGVFDIDIHGASVPNYFGLKPPVRRSPRGLEPKKAKGIAVMSLSLFTGDNPVSIRGERSTRSLITEFFALTNWGRLDFLIVDLPPSTGDELLTAFSLFGAKSKLILVTTPSRNAVNVVLRLRRLAEAERIPVQGIVVNMAYAKEGRRWSKTIYPFGKPSDEIIGRELKSTVMVEIPLEPKVNSEGLAKVIGTEKNDVSRAFRHLESLVRG
jgi:ATP-binding protein involved in chromosome partitioning